ncbi:MAG: hypothetical protein E7332_01605 [Clostridiales bacterium]|nr:hypothetical protein [Clostridiales bacterium]
MKISLITINIFADRMGDLKNPDRAKSEARYYEVLNLAKEAGYPYIDMCYWEVEALGFDFVKNAIEKTGLAVNAVTYFVEMQEEEALLMAKAKQILENIRALGAKHVTYVLLPSEKMQREGREALYQYSVKNLQPLCLYAEEIGLVSSLENSPDIGMPLARVSELKRLFEEVPALCLAYDSFNMQVVSEEPAAYLDAFGKNIANVHLKDGTYVSEPSRFSNDTADGRLIAASPSGKGLADFPWLFDRFRALGYDAAVAVEFMPGGGDLLSELREAREYFESLM